MKIFAAPKKIRKFSVRNASKFATQPACSIVPVVIRPCEDLQECRGGRPSNGRADFCAISHDFGSKFLRRRKNFEIFRSETRLKMRPNPHAASCQCSADLVRTRQSAAEVGRRPAGLICAQSRTILDEKFWRHRKNSKIFGPKRD